MLRWRLLRHAVDVVLLALLAHVVGAEYRPHLIAVRDYDYDFCRRDGHDGHHVRRAHGVGAHPVRLRVRESGCPLRRVRVLLQVLSHHVRGVHDRGGADVADVPDVR